MDTAGLVVIGLVMLVGLVGCLFPVVPGVLVIWGAGLVWALTADVDVIRWLVLALFTVLAILGGLAKFALSGRAAAARGAPGSILLAAIAGGIVGAIVIPVIGFIPGAVFGVLLAERIRLRTWGAAWNSTRSVLLSYGVGVGIELIAGIIMVGTWLLVVLLT